MFATPCKMQSVYRPVELIGNRTQVSLSKSPDLVLQQRCALAAAVGTPSYTDNLARPQLRVVFELRIALAIGFLWYEPSAVGGIDVVFVRATSREILVIDSIRPRNDTD